MKQRPYKKILRSWPLIWSVLAIVWLPSMGTAQESARRPTKNPPTDNNPCADPNLCAIALRKGQPAPFSGQLLTVDLALQLGQVADGCAASQQAAVARCQADAAIDIQHEKDSRKADAEMFTASTLAAQQRLARAQKLAEDQAPPFFARPWFVAPVTAVLTASVIVWVMHH